MTPAWLAFSAVTVAAGAAILWRTAGPRVAAAGRASEQVHESRFRMTLDALPQMVWSAGPDGALDYYNKRWIDYTGLSLAQSLGRGWEPVLHPEDLGACLERWTASLTSGEPYEIEYRFKRASDGAYRWHLGRALPVRDDDGTIIKWIGTSTDIHDQKEAIVAIRRSERAFEEAEARFRRVQDASPDSFILLDVVTDDAGEMTNGRIVYANPAASTLMARRSGSLTGRLLDEAFPGARASGRYELYARVYRTGETETLTFRHPEVGKWLRIIVVKIDAGICIISADVSELKAAEAVLRGAHKELERLVADRTRELEFALSAAEDASRAKSEFLSRASHELRTPLNAVIGFSTILLKNRSGALSETELAYADRIARNGKHLLSLVNDLLDISRIEAGKMELDLTRFSLRDLVQDVRTTLEGGALEAGLLLTIDLPSDEEAPSDLSIIADEQRLRQVLINLVGNAIKYTERGAVLVRIVADDDGRPNRIDVGDTGRGIAADRIDAMFEPFVTAASPTAADESTGLGLAISRSLCNAMGYRLSATSVPGEGSTFTIDFLPDELVGAGT